ncbi:MAG: hypothetical protein Q4A42_02895 [Tissierellia bacterium]|nr:hypothetical protein [Tissierellia bacterium]
MANKIKLDFSNEIFDEVKLKIDNQLRIILSNLHSNKFEAGNLTIKIDIEKNEETRTVVDETETAVQEVYTNLKINHKVTTTLKKNFSEDGTFKKKNLEFKFVNDEYILAEQESRQLSMDLEQRG